jgi:hypothetical protein
LQKSKSKDIAEIKGIQITPLLASRGSDLMKRSDKLFNKGEKTSWTKSLFNSNLVHNSKEERPSGSIANSSIRMNPFCSNSKANIIQSSQAEKTIDVINEDSLKEDASTIHNFDTMHRAIEKLKFL